MERWGRQRRGRDDGCEGKDDVRTMQKRKTRLRNEGRESGRRWVVVCVGAGGGETGDWRQQICKCYEAGDGLGMGKQRGGGCRQGGRPPRADNLFLSTPSSPPLSLSRTRCLMKIDKVANGTVFEDTNDSPRSGPGKL